MCVGFEVLTVEVATCFTLISCLAYSQPWRRKQHIPPKDGWLSTDYTARCSTNPWWEPRSTHLTASTLFMFGFGCGVPVLPHYRCNRSAGEWLMLHLRFMSLCLSILYTPVSSCIYKQAIKTFNKWTSWCEAKYKRKRHCHCGIFGLGSAGSVKGGVGLMAERTEQYNHYTNLLTAVSRTLVTCVASPGHPHSRHLRCFTRASCRW
jgi:hypothetical protein